MKANGLIPHFLAPTLFLLAPVLDAAGAEAQPKPFLHPLFTDNMVLQRDCRAPVWGWVEPGAKVTVTVKGKSFTAVADAQGKWIARVGPFPFGGPYTMSVTAREQVTLTNVALGDVWICSGQSNMEMGIAGVNNAEAEIGAANYPDIRLYTVPKRIATTPQETIQGKWEACSPTTVAAGGWGGFSAVAFFFGRHLHEQVDVPIGLLHTSWGGTVAEAWTSAEALQEIEDFRPALEGLARTAQKPAQTQADYELAVAEWFARNDPGSTATPGWADPALDTADWKTMDLPQNWEKAGMADFDGVVWFRKELDLPADWAGKAAVLHLGPIDDADVTWVNGVKVGATSDWSQSRDYQVAKDILKSGKNVIVTRVLDTGGGGGIYGQPEQLKLDLAESSEVKPVSLAGPWLHREGVALKTAGPMPQRLDNNPNIVTVLYNGMIAPLLPFSIKGAIWYQGESNANRAAQYRALLPAMIHDWRARFGVGEFPFLIVQLASFMEEKPEPGESAWAELREAQFLTTQTVPKTGLAVAIDIGDAVDIHPKNKQEVGRRLALAAEAIVYGRKIEYSGPVFRTIEPAGEDRLRVFFNHVQGGLTVKGRGPVRGFAIAGEDGKFQWAKAVIEGNTAVLSSTNVAKPTVVRYGWADNPGCNLCNGCGLPAVPFRTDKPAK